MKMKDNNEYGNADNDGVLVEQKEIRKRGEETEKLQLNKIVLYMKYNWVGSVCFKLCMTLNCYLFIEFAQHNFYLLSVVNKSYPNI